MFRIRDVLCLLAAGAAIALCFAASADARIVRLQGHRVTVRVVGQIDAWPCPEKSCLKAVVGTRWNGVGRDHVVRCAYPRRLHVVSAKTGRGGRSWAHVFACAKVYRWRIG